MKTMHPEHIAIRKSSDGQNVISLPGMPAGTIRIGQGNYLAGV